VERDWPKDSRYGVGPGSGLLSGADSMGQVTTATFYAIVQDPASAVIVGAEVSLINEGTGAVVSRRTDVSGEAHLTFLPVGRYTLRIQAPGFKTHEARGLEFLAAQSVRRSFALELGAVTESVEVTAQTALLNTVSAEQSENISRERVSELPLARRNLASVLAWARASRATAAR